jgi:hypothetical protein
MVARDLVQREGTPQQPGLRSLLQGLEVRLRENDQQNSVFRVLSPHTLS